MHYVVQVQGYKYYAGTRGGWGWGWGCGGVGWVRRRPVERQNIFIIIACAPQPLIPGMTAESPVDKLLPAGLLCSLWCK